MIVKSWKFTGFKATFPEWVQENTSKSDVPDGIFELSEIREYFVVSLVVDLLCAFNELNEFGVAGVNVFDGAKVSVLGN